MTAYVIAATAGMLLIYHDFYYDILETKFTFYCICTIVMLIFIGGWLFLTAHPVEALKKRRGKKLFEVISPADVAVVLWGICIVCATVFSPVKKYALFGNAGRYTGCLLLMLYIAAYFCITRYYQAKEWHMAVFLAAGMFMCLFGITDFFDMDLLHFKEEISQVQRYKFTSTIGNINTYTSCVAMVMAFAGVMFVSAGKMKKTVGYGICTVVSFTALILGESDNAYLSLAAFFGLLPFYAFRNRSGVRRYMILAAIFFTAVKGVGIIQGKMENQPIVLTGLFQVIAGSKILPLVIVILWCAAGACCWRDYKRHEEDQALDLRLIKGWLILVILVGAAAVFILYDVNVAGNGDRYGGITNYLLFNDEWGTHRGYVWRIAVEDYKSFPLMQKIFGYGPDTFGIITRMNNYPEMVDLYQEIFDSAHNEYLQYFVTIGPLGLLSYVAVHIAAVVQVMRKRRDNPLAVGALMAVLCYDFQAAVNINQPIAAPVMWTLLALSV